jgi:hypothetical protein
MRKLILAAAFISGSVLSSAINFALAENSQATRAILRSDQNAGAVLIEIDGKEVARMDAGGLHVKGDVSYSGTLTDTGTAGHRP